MGMTILSREGKVPDFAFIILLMACLLSPYGIFSYGGGSLRPDHVLLPLVFVFLLIFGKVRMPGTFAKTLILFAALSVISSIFYPELLIQNPLNALKNLDGLLRGPMVLMIASSIQWKDRTGRIFTMFFVSLSVLFLLLALLQFIFPADSPLIELISAAYGGPAYQEGQYGDMNVNHLQLMLMTQRSTAIFVTAPSLGMASLLFILIASIPSLGLGTIWRAALMIAGFSAGLLAKSKSFLFGLFILGILGIILNRRIPKTILLLPVFVLFTTALLVSYGIFDVGFSFMLDSYPAEFVTTDFIYDITGGRYGGGDWTVTDVTYDVIKESTLIGFGLGEMPGIIYSDSGLNRFLLHAGLIGTIVVATGIWVQLKWFLAFRKESSWALLGAQALLICLFLFLAGPIFVMPRINDIFFALIGICTVAVRHTGYNILRKEKQLHQAC